MRNLEYVAVIAALTAIAASIDPATAADPSELVRAAIRLPCQAAPGTGLASLSERLPGARPKRVWVRSPAPAIDSQNLSFRMVFGAAADELTVDFKGPIGRPDYVSARYLSGVMRRPQLLARADGSCTIHTARELIYDLQGRPEWLQNLDSRLRPVGAPAPQNPPVPAGHDPAGIAVGVVDSGVNYLLPEIATRLARDRNGRIFGYDYRDLDRRPFDAEPTSDPFFPGRHGTRIASLLLEEAPVAKLVPYRYPRSAMARMAPLIDAAAAHDVRIMNLSLATPERDPWRPFEAAARAHPKMLFVVAAGNQGHDLGSYPAYPAALDLANMIVVTSAGARGHLSPGVNFGSRAVDVMAEGENVEALDFDGVRRPVSGSSYATARVSALAACLLADHLDWSASELKAAIIEEAESSGRPEVRYGFLANAALRNRGACRKMVADCDGPGSRC